MGKNRKYFKNNNIDTIPKIKIPYSTSGKDYISIELSKEQINEIKEIFHIKEFQSLNESITLFDEGESDYGGVFTVNSNLNKRIQKLKKKYKATNISPLLLIAQHYHEILYKVNINEEFVKYSYFKSEEYHDLWNISNFLDEYLYNESFTYSSLSISLKDKAGKTAALNINSFNIIHLILEFLSSRACSSKNILKENKIKMTKDHEAFIKFFENKYGTFPRTILQEANTIQVNYKFHDKKEQDYTSQINQLYTRYLYQYLKYYVDIWDLKTYNRKHDTKICNFIIDFYDAIKLPNTRKAPYQSKILKKHNKKGIPIRHKEIQRSYSPITWSKKSDSYDSRKLSKIIRNWIGRTTPKNRS